MQNMNLAMVVLIAGLIIVFVMLILLTLIIKLYGTIIYKNQTRKKQAASKTKSTAKAKSSSGNSAGTENNFVSSDDLSDEIVAVISAAVASLGEANSKYYAIKSIKQSLNQATLNRSEWGMAGKFQNTKPFWN